MATREHISRAIIRHGCSAACQQFPQTRSQVITMKTLKEDTQIRRVCVDDLDLGVQSLRQTTFKFSEGRCLPLLALPRYTSVIQADATSPSSLRLLRLPEKNT